MNLAEAFRKFGLERQEIYGAVERGEVHDVWRPARDRRSEHGQIEYPEWELKKLADDLGLTIVHLKSPASNNSSAPSYPPLNSELPLAA